MPPPINSADDIAMYLGFENCNDPKYRKFYRDSQEWITSKPPMIEGPALRKELWASEVPNFVLTNRNNFQHVLEYGEPNDQDLRIAHDFLMGCAKNLRRKPVRAARRQNAATDPVDVTRQQRTEPRELADIGMTSQTQALAQEVHHEPENVPVQTPQPQQRRVSKPVNSDRRSRPAPATNGFTSNTHSSTNNTSSSNRNNTTVSSGSIPAASPLTNFNNKTRTLILKYGKNLESASAITVEECANWNTMLAWAAMRANCDTTSVEAISCQTKELIGCDLEVNDQLTWNGALASTAGVERLFCTIKPKEVVQQQQQQQHVQTYDLPEEPWQTEDLSTSRQTDTSNKRPHPGTEEDSYATDPHKRLRQPDPVAQAAELHPAPPPPSHPPQLAANTMTFNDLASVLRQETNNSTPRYTQRNQQPIRRTQAGGWGYNQM